MSLNRPICPIQSSKPLALQPSPSHIHPPRFQKRHPFFLQPLPLLILKHWIALTNRKLPPSIANPPPRHPIPFHLRHHPSHLPPTSANYCSDIAVRHDRSDRNPLDHLNQQPLKLRHAQIISPPERGHPCPRPPTLMQSAGQGHKKTLSESR